jgi:hypothetical protein
LAKVARSVSKAFIPVVKNGYLFRGGSELPIPLGTDTFDYWFRHSPQFRIVIPDGSGRWVGAKKDKGLIVLQKRVKGKLFQTSCGRSYPLRFLPPDYLESRALDLSEKITVSVGEWGNKFPVDIPSQQPGHKTATILKGKPDNRDQRDYERILSEGELEYLILECGQGYLFTAEKFYDFFEKKFPLVEIKKAIGRQRAAGNILRRRDGYYCVSEIAPRE